MPVTLEQLRAHAVRRSLFGPLALPEAIARLGFVQADPIRAPARAQDLILRHRVEGYRAGDLERRYPELEVEEDAFVNYGFLPRTAWALMHPRELTTPLRIEREAPGLAEAVLEFVKGNGPTHPRALEKHFGRTSVGNYWGGTSSATTRVLDGLHYRGLLRVARRDGGVKVFEAARALEPSELRAEERARGLVRLIVDLYAPLPEASLRGLVSFLGYGAPHLKPVSRAIVKGMVGGELTAATVDGVRYVWPAGEESGGEAPDEVRLLAPFDPVVWDRRRFEHLWGWAYRFEAYTPAARRKLGYYALPLLWRDRVIGWANLKIASGRLETELGFVEGRTHERAFETALEAELERAGAFLRLGAG